MIPKHRIDGTHIPTKIPWSWWPRNQRVTEKTNDANAARTIPAADRNRNCFLDMALNSWRGTLGCLRLGLDAAKRDMFLE